MFPGLAGVTLWIPSCDITHFSFCLASVLRISPVPGFSEIYLSVDSGFIAEDFRLPEALGPALPLRATMHCTLHSLYPSYFDIPNCGSNTMVHGSNIAQLSQRPIYSNNKIATKIQRSLASSISSLPERTTDNFME